MTIDLTKYRLPMQAITERMETAIQRGIEPGSFPEADRAPDLFNAWDRYADRSLRADDGRALVTCTTDMPGVTPAMIDWWFGWHLPLSERYQLWHPKAHLAARVKDDRSALPGDREKYLDNVSYVDEYIGPSLMRLSIAFFHPREVGLGSTYDEGATAICARTADRVRRTRSGHLVHLVLPTAAGSEMRSAFWLGSFESQLPLVRGLLKPLLNRRFVRQALIGNSTATDLQRHCAEEMSHLARFLPNLYVEAMQG